MQALPKGEEFYYGLPGAVTVPLQITFGATGAVASWKGRFFTNVVRNSQGVYTLTLDHQFRAFMGFRGTHWKLAGATTPLAVVSTAASPDGVTGPTMVVNTLSGSTPTDPANGDTVYIWPTWNEVQPNSFF